MNLKIENTASSKEVSKTTAADTDKLKKEAKARGEYIVTVSGDEKGLSAIAKIQFGMSLTDFKNMTGLTKDALQKGQVKKMFLLQKSKAVWDLPHLHVKTVCH